MTSRSNAPAFALCLSLGGCGTFSIDHVFGTDGTEHKWHTVPATVGMWVVGVPMFVIASPIILVEELGGVRSALHEASNGLSPWIVVPPMVAAGYLFALPPLLVGLPWESSAKHEEGHAEEQREPSK